MSALAIEPTTLIHLVTYECVRCNSSFEYGNKRGNPKYCSDCREYLKSHRDERIAYRKRHSRNVADLMALRLTNYRLAIEIASSAIALGRYTEAKQILDEARFVPEATVNNVRKLPRG